MGKNTIFENVSFLSIFNQAGLQLLINEVTFSKVKLYMKNDPYAYCSCGQCFGSILDLREKETNFAGQIHAEYLLQNQEIIPEKWRQLTLVFLGTIWGTSTLVGNKYVPCLYFDKNKWKLELTPVDRAPDNAIMHFKEIDDQFDKNVELISIMPEGLI